MRKGKWATAALSCWQRCTIHMMRNVLSHVSHGDKRAVMAMYHTLLAEPTRAEAQRQRATMLSAIKRRCGK